MKLVLVDTSITGHHVPYIQALSNLADETIAILPEELTSLSIPQRICSFPRSSQRRFSDFLRWVKAVKSIVEQEKPDIVHFLMGDDFYRFFGAGLGLFARYKVVVTLHWMRNGFAGRLSTKAIAWHSDSMVVHSTYMQQKLCSYGIKHVVHIEYPQFGTVFYPKEEARAHWQLRQDTPVIVCIGGTRHDKGLDILLEALEKVEQPFQLLIAGKAEHFSEDFIRAHTQSYSDCVHCHMRFLSDEELASAVCAADVIALPYRRKFDGASGPLGDGVVHSKLIVGPDHGNLGDAIRRNHLGYTFETENVDSLADVLNRALGEKWEPDAQYLEYQKMLSVDRFQEVYRVLYRKLTWRA